MPLSPEAIKQLQNLRDLLISVIKPGATAPDGKSVYNIDARYCAGANLGLIIEAIQNAPHLVVLPDHILQALRNIMDVLSDHDAIYIFAHELYYSSESTFNKLQILDCFHIINCYTNYLKENELKPLKIASILKTQYYWQSKLMHAFEKSDKRVLTDDRILEVGAILLNELSYKNPFYNGVSHHLENVEKVFKLISKKNKPLRTYSAALLQFHRGNYHEAIKFAKMITNDSSLPRIANTCYLLARCYLATNQLVEALDILKIGYLEKHNFECTYELAVLLFQIQEIEDALEILRNLAKRDRESAFQYYLLCKDGVIANEDAQSARVYLNRAKNLGDPRAMYETGRILEKEGNYQEAIEYFEAAKLCNNLPAIIRLIDLYTNKAEVCDLEKAKENHLLAARKNNTMERIYIADRLWHGKSGFQVDREEAKIHYELAMANLFNALKDPDFAHTLGGIHYTLAMIYASEYKNDLPEALKHCDLAIKYKNAEAKKVKRDILKQIKLSQPADDTVIEDPIEEPEEVEEKKPLTIDDLIAQADKLNVNGHYAEAITTWKHILKLNYQPMMRIKCLYGVGFNYICWSKRDDAPTQALAIAQRKFEKILTIILTAFNHPNTTPAELDQLEFWQQAVINEANHLRLNINVDEDYSHHKTKRPATATATATPTLMSSPAIENKVEAALTKSKAKLDLSPGVLYVIEKLKSQGHRTLVVGGAVRDQLLGRHIKDYDLITRCPLPAILSLFPGKAVIVGKRHEIVIVEHNGEQIEISNYQSILRDYQSRDFRINGYYYDTDTHEILSFSDTLDDIHHCLIQTIGDPDKSFTDDPIRMLRAINLKAKIKFNLTAKTEASLIRNLTQLKTVNADRLFGEFLKLFINPNNNAIIKLLHHYHILENILPFSVSALVSPTQSIQVALEDARRDKKTNPALLMAVILWPALNEKLRTCNKTVEALEKCIKDVLDKQCEYLVLPEKLYNKIRCIWRMYLMMKNIYKSTPDTKSVHFIDYLLTKQFFLYLNGREFSLNPKKITNKNEVMLLSYTSPMKQLIHAINSNDFQKAKDIISQHPQMHLKSGNNSCWLHLAATNGSVKIMALFIKMDGHLNCTDATLQTPLHYAAVKGHIDAIKYLIEQGALVDAMDINGKNILHLAAERGQMGAVEFIIKQHPLLLSQVCLNGETALHAAVKSRHYHIVKLLLAHIDTEILDRKGKRAVDYAVNDESYRELATIINAAKSPVKIPSQLSYKALKKCNIALLTGLSDTMLERLKRNLLQHRLFASNACTPAATELKPPAPNQV